MQVRDNAQSAAIKDKSGGFLAGARVGGGRMFFNLSRSLKIYLQALLSIMLYLTSTHLKFFIYYSCPLLTRICVFYVCTVTYKR
jgi:hypothetical protein